MTKEVLSDSQVEGGKLKGMSKKKKIILGTISAILIAGGLTLGVGVSDVNKAKKRKATDTELYGKVDVKPGKTVDIIQFPGIDGGPDTLNVPLEDILGHNSDIVGVDATRLESIMLGEESLKTTNGGRTKKKIEELEEKGVDRSPYSQSFIGRFLSKIKEGSYGPYQTQPDAIDKYKDDPELYDDLCKKIAVFELPDINGEYVPLHEQLGLTVDEMVKKIKNHEIYTFAGGERFLVAYGIVLIDQISREVESKVDSYDGTKGYNTWINNTSNVEQDHKELRGTDNDIMAPYILTNKGNVSYNKVGELFNNDAFINGMVSAYWCMDYIKNTENCNYLYLLSLLELNEWFNNPRGDLDIVVPTGRFGPSTVKLVNKHFGTNFNPENDAGLKEARNYMDSLSSEELQRLKDSALNSFEKNMRLLYTLNSGDNHGINQAQAKYLSECLDITFNHMYAGVTIFSEFVNNNCLDKSDSLNQLRSNFVQKHDKSSLEDLKKIMTDEDSFTSFTGLDKASYLKWIKYHLCPTLLGATDWVHQTGGIIPVIQDNPGGTRKSNEQNSIFRFTIGVSQEEMAQIDREKGVKYALQPGDRSINDMKYIMWNQEPVRNYLQTCKTIDGKTIASPEDIPDELVIVMVRGNDGFFPLFEGGKLFYEGDTVRIKYIGLDSVYYEVIIDQPAEKKIPVTKWQKKGKKKKPIKTFEKQELCTVGPHNTLKMAKGGTFQEILFIYSQNNSQFKEVLESIAGKPITKQSDIDQNLIKTVIRHPNGKMRKDIDSVNEGDKFIIVIPLNY